MHARLALLSSCGLSGSGPSYSEWDGDKVLCACARAVSVLYVSE